jgi:hypothetical protein
VPVCTQRRRPPAWCGNRGPGGVGHRGVVAGFGSAAISGVFAKAARGVIGKTMVKDVVEIIELIVSLMRDVRCR